MPIRYLCLAILYSFWRSDAFRGKSRRLIDKAAKAGQYGQCVWSGPDGGSTFQVAFPKKNCALMCKGSLYEIETKVMPYFFARTKFSESKHSCYCYKLQEMKPVFAFTSKESDCGPAQCWHKLKWMLNFEIPDDSHVAQTNIENFKTSCEPCASLETCPEKLTLPEFLNGVSSSHEDEAEVGEARTKVEEALDAEGITLNPVLDDEVESLDIVESGQDELLDVNQATGEDDKKDDAKVWVRAPSYLLTDENDGDIEASTEIKVVKDVKEVDDNPVLAPTIVKGNSSNDLGAVPDGADSGASCEPNFQLSCKVQAGPNGDEWLETAQEDCIGNELVVQINPDYPESLIAIRVDSVDHVARYGLHKGKMYGFIDTPASHMMSEVGNDTFPFAPSLHIKRKYAKATSTPFVSFWHSKAPLVLTIIGKNGQSVKLPSPMKSLRLYYFPHKPSSVAFRAAPAPTFIKKPAATPWDGTAGTFAQSFMGQLRELLMMPQDVELVQPPTVEGVLPVLPPDCVRDF